MTPIPITAALGGRLPPDQLAERIHEAGYDRPIYLHGAMEKLTELYKREGIALARKQGKYRGRKKALSAEQVQQLRRRVQAGESKAALARELGISRETLYQYLERPE